MKKYRVTNLHEVLKAGYEFSHDVSIPFVKLILNGSELTIYTDDILRHHPTWYEEVKPERWEPRSGEGVWYINSRGYVKHKFYSSIDVRDEIQKDFGNVFRTNELAEKAKELVEATLIAYQEEITK